MCTRGLHIGAVAPPESHIAEQGRAPSQANPQPVQDTPSQTIHWEALTAVGTWLLALATWALAASAKKSAKDQIAVTERMANANIETLKEDLKTRLLLHYETQWDSREMVKHRQALSQNFLSLRDHPAGPRIFYETTGTAVPNFFESVGMQLRRGHLDTEMVLIAFGYPAMRYGQMLGEFIVQSRRAHHDEELYSEFLYLFETLCEFEADRRGRPHAAFPMEEIIRFLNEEAGQS